MENILCFQFCCSAVFVINQKPKPLLQTQVPLKNPFIALLTVEYLHKHVVPPAFISPVLERAEQLHYVLFS